MSATAITIGEGAHAPDPRVLELHRVWRQAEAAFVASYEAECPKGTRPGDYRYRSSEHSLATRWASAIFYITGEAWRLAFRGEA